MNPEVLRYHFDSWSDFVTVADTGFTPMRESDRSSRRDRSAYWSGTETWGEALTMARTGWPEVADRIEKFSGSLFASIANYIVKPDIAMGYEGIDYDIGRLLDGEPEHWIYQTEAQETRDNGRTVCKILYNCIASGACDRETLEAKGAVLAALVRLLDYSGIRAEIVLGTWNGSSSHCYNLAHTVTVKRSSEDLDMPLVGYALAHVSAYRRLFFAHWEINRPEVLHNLDITAGGGYGYCGSFPIEEQLQYDIYIDRSMWGEPQWSDPQSATAWVLEQLKRAGVTLTQEAN